MSTDFGRKNGRHRDWARDVEAETSAGGEEDALWRLLSVYADGEATPEEAAQVEAHLRANPAVARDMEFLRLASQSVQSFPEMKPPASLRDSIFAATTRRQTLRSRLVVGWSELRRALSSEPARYVVPVGGALALASLAVLFFHPHGGTPGLDRKQLATAPPSESNMTAAKSDVNKPHTTSGMRKSASPSLLPPKTKSTFMVDNPIPVERPRKSTDDKVLTPKLRLATVGTSSTKKSSVFRTVMNTIKAKSSSFAAQRPSVIDPGETMPVPYSPHPMMDVPNLHASAADGTPEGAIGGADVVATDTTKTAVASATAGNTPEPKVIVRHAPPLNLAQLPPDSRHIITGGDIKRIREASRLGYNQETVDSIERRQAMLAVVSGRF